MISAKEYENEPERIEDLKSYSIIDTLPEEDYDNLTKLAVQICGTPIALISLVDEKKQWFKSHQGWKISETPREFAFCTHAFQNPKEILVIPDARIDERFHDNPLVKEDPEIVFYAGVSLISPQGHPFGSLCVMDHKPRNLSEDQITALKSLSKQVINLLELRKSRMDLDFLLENSITKNKEVENFAYVIAHDIKSPLNNIMGLTELVLLSQESQLSEIDRDNIQLIKYASNKLREFVDALLAYSKSGELIKEVKSTILVSELESEIEALYPIKEKGQITWQANVNEIIVNRIAIKQILVNLIGNAIKYNDKDEIWINVLIRENQDFYEMSILDNGRGISKEDQKRIFNLYEVVNMKDKFGRSGDGIGLATVKKLVTRLGGDIRVESEEGKGSKFIFTIEK